MSAAPQIVPMSDLRIHQAEVLRKMGKAPVYLAQRGRPAAVLVSFEQWDALLEELDDLQSTVWSLQSELNIATGKSKLVEMSPEELEAWAQDEEKVPA